ncbi:hypothetical protein [Hymenobacter metallicola]|uniref:Uncharacterized protein n=1 Tax=Hymenobacter metallicola TaxID=2563114 RepID=A0A4Z0QKP5_9BACT|nr:hypothetical protein [Hymenobacter metallicola]TGE29829.1 hypothetical protein E5K02_10320 [Hymenobacter metallicola]
MFKNVKSAASALAAAVLGATTTVPTQAEPVKKEPVVVRTAREGKASRQLLRLYSLGLITLSPADLDRHEDVVLADEVRKANNRDQNRFARHYANPANRPKPHHKVPYGCKVNTGAFGDDMPMNDSRRARVKYVGGELVSLARPRSQDEPRTPNEIARDNARSR